MHSPEPQGPYRAAPQVPCPLDRAKVIYERALRNSIRFEIAENIVVGAIALYMQTLIHEGQFSSKTLFQSGTLLIAALVHTVKKLPLRKNRHKLNEYVHHAASQGCDADTVSQEIDKLGYKSLGKKALLIALANIAIRFLWAHNNWDDGKLSIALNLDLVTIVGFLIATWINDYKLKQSSRNLIEIITNTSEKTRVVETVRVDDHFSEQAEESNLASDTKIRFVAV